MESEKSNLLHAGLSKKIIETYFKVYNKLGYGFLENVYEKSLLIELHNAGLNSIRQKKLKVYYDDHEVGLYFADILVENKIIIEIKAAKGLLPEHENQLLNYLKATEIEVGLLINFGTKPEFRRKIFENKFKYPFRPV
ncbi:MAG: GxxExxY protein [Chitinophagales bacterium]